MHQDRRHTNNTTGRSSTRVAGLQAFIIPAFTEVVRALPGTRPLALFTEPQRLSSLLPHAQLRFAQ